MPVPRPASFVKNLGAALAAKYWSSETAVMTTLAVLVGASAGLGIALFRRLLDGLFALTVGAFGAQFPFALILFPTLGGLLAALWMAQMAREGQTGLGVAGIMEAVALHTGRISLRGSLARVIGAVLTVGLGGSAGPEDPSVQIGAALGSQAAQRLRLESAAGAELVELDLSQGDAGVGKQLIAECGTSKGSMLRPAARRAPVQGR